MDYLPGWKAALMTMAGRSTLVHVVMTVPIYMLAAIDVPKWLILSIDKRQRAFLWKRQQQINGGHCPIT
jgi:hypothetical protein